VYRFLDDKGCVLYVGKSVDIRSRVRSHFADSNTSQRKARMVSAIRHVDCRPTAGEVGALLLENAAIKRELPLFNRRQRSIRRMWSFQLAAVDGDFLQPRLQCFSLDKPDVTATYGSYLSRYHATKALTKLARNAQLCPAVLGLERGRRGPCFQYQIRRCLGACVGEETPGQHNERLRDALDGYRLSAWPITTPVLLRESDTSGHALAPRREWHLLHNWIYMGTFENPELAAAADISDAYMFDRDTYHILRSVLSRSDIILLDAASMAPVAWARETQTHDAATRSGT
jgi:hypothetical protein